MEPSRVGVGVVGEGLPDVLVSLGHSHPVEQRPHAPVLAHAQVHTYTPNGAAARRGPGSLARDFSREEGWRGGGEQVGVGAAGKRPHGMARVVEKHSSFADSAIAPSVITRARLNKNFAALCASRLQDAAEQHHFFGVCVRERERSRARACERGTDRDRVRERDRDMDRDKDRDGKRMRENG